MTRSFSIREYWSDDRLIRSKVSFMIRNPVRNNQTPPDNLKSFRTLCDSNLADLLDNAVIESTWSVFKNAVYGSSQETHSYVKKKYQDWIDSKYSPCFR